LALLKLLSAESFFPQGKIFKAVNNFSCYMRPRVFQPAGLHPKFSATTDKVGNFHPSQPLSREGRQKFIISTDHPRVSNFFANMNGISHSHLRKRAVRFSNRHCPETLRPQKSFSFGKILSHLRGKSPPFANPRSPL
jgi:hypothetical protein